MRKRIAPGDYRGSYTDEIRPDDLIIMCDSLSEAAGFIDLADGILESLWRLSLETDLGMIVDIRKIPMKQADIDRSNERDVDPYDQPMDGRIYIAHPVSEYHLREDVSVIGYLTGDRKCIIKNGDRISYLRSRGEEKEKGHE